MPDPLDPVVDVGTRQQIGHGVGVAQGSPAEEGLEKPDLVVPEHVAGPALVHQRPHRPQNLQARRAPVDQVPDQPELEVFTVDGSDAPEKLLELRAAPLNVPDEHHLHERQL